MSLPEFWQFLSPGWWIVHLFGIAIIFLLGMGHGRRQALKMIEDRERQRGAGPAVEDPPSRGVGRP